ncbi:hypothetical protein D3C81_1740260 [compost metagenome]
MTLASLLSMYANGASLAYPTRILPAALAASSVLAPTAGAPPAAGAGLSEPESEQAARMPRLSANSSRPDRIKVMDFSPVIISMCMASLKIIRY